MIRIRKKNYIELIISLILIFMIFSYILTINFSNKYIQYLNYFDEILTCFSILLYFIILLYNYRQKLKKDFFLLILLSVVTLIGLISNYYSRLLNSKIGIITDVIALFKVFMPFLVLYRLKPNKDVIVDNMYFFSKIFIFVSFIFLILNQIFELGLGTDFRYGINSYCFLYKNEARFGLTLACLLIFILEKQKGKKDFLYIFMAVTQMIFTTKSIIYVLLLGAGLYYFLYIKRIFKNKIVLFFVISILILIFVNPTIEKYLLSSNTPRSLFIKYGFVTAIEYFPFGSGFGTFGSDVAATYYSPLYYDYGFNEVYGMNFDNPLFLNDVYFGMIVGQYGFIGTILFLFILSNMFITFFKSYTNNRVAKCFLIGIIFSLAASTVATAIIKSSIGMFVLIVLSVFSIKGDKIYEK